MTQASKLNYRMRKVKDSYRTECGSTIKSSGLDKLILRDKKNKNLLKVFRIGDVLHPNCGHRPNDFVIEDIVLIAKKEAYSFWGYHPASEEKRRFCRGFIYKDDKLLMKN